MANSRVIRTFSILGADGAGKTALVEALWRVADPKRATADGSTSRLDAEPEEKKRNFTLSLHPESFEEGGRVVPRARLPRVRRRSSPRSSGRCRSRTARFLAVSAADGAHNRAERTYDVLAESGRPAIAVVTRSTTSRPTSHEGARRRRDLAQGEADPAAAPHRRAGRR